MDPATMLLAGKALLGIYTANRSRKRQTEALNGQLNVGRNLISIGGELERSELALRMEEELTASTEQAAFNSEALNEALASQKALFAFRGQKSNEGSALAIKNSSEQKYIADERARELGLTFKNYTLQTMQRTSQLNQISSIYNLNTGIANKKQEVNEQWFEKATNIGGAFAGQAGAASGNKLLSAAGTDLGKKY